MHREHPAVLDFRPDRYHLYLKYCPSMGASLGISSVVDVPSLLRVTMYGTISTPAMGVSVFNVARVTTKFFASAMAFVVYAIQQRTHARERELGFRPPLCSLFLSFSLVRGRARFVLSAHKLYNRVKVSINVLSLSSSKTSSSQNGEREGERKGGRERRRRRRSSSSLSLPFSSLLSSESSTTTV